MNLGEIKKKVKKSTLDIGIYRPVRNLSDFFTNRVRRQQIKRDTLFYKELLKPNSLCFDVGANTGEKTFALLKAGMRVVAFEPQVECAREIEARCYDYRDKLEIVQAGVGAAEGTAKLYVKDLSVITSFDKDWEGTVTETVEVPITTLKDSIAKFGQPDYCKIDVEGWEVEVLSGLDVLIPLITLEYNLSEKGLANTQKCLDLLTELSSEALLINISPLEDYRLEFETWYNMDQFSSVFPSKFIDRENFSFGDLWIRMA